MIKQYFKLILRLLKRDKLFSIINISGLSIGLAAAFIILLFVLNEVTYDWNHKNIDRVYRIITIDTVFNVQLGSGCHPMKEAMEEEYPQVEKVARSLLFQELKVKQGVDYIDEQNMQAADIELLYDENAEEVITVVFRFSDGSTEPAEPYFEDFILDLEEFFGFLDSVYADW